MSTKTGPDMQPTPDDERDRLADLAALGAIDQSSNPTLDLITQSLSKLFHVPIVLVSLIDANRQVFKSCVGLDVQSTSREIAFCAHAIMRDDVMCVPDAREDDRFAQNPLVTGTPHIRFYAGAPLISAEGYRLGTLCVIDVVPRSQLSPDDEATLKGLAILVVRELERGRATPASEAAYLREAKVKAEQADRAKAEFLAMVSHELKTPLNIILGFSDLIRKETFGALGNQLYQDYANSVYESGEHLQTMIGTILDFASADKGQLKVDESEVAISEEIEKCLRLLSEKASRFSVIARAKPVHGLPLLKADKHHVMQMLLNVIGNAIKFNRPGGTVVVSTDLQPDGSLALSVVDTGVGIPTALIDRLSSPFSQIDGRLARQHEGIGLGLSITRRLIELHGGALSVSSRVGEGSCVTLSFPASRLIPTPPQHSVVA